MPEPQAPRRSERDLIPSGFARKNDCIWFDKRGHLWWHVRRREIDQLTNADWQNAMLVLRYPARGWRPCNEEGRFLQDLLISQGPTEVHTALLIISAWEEDPHGYIARGVRDKRAYLALLVPVGSAP